MGARNYRELACWQLAVELRDKTIALIPTVPRPEYRDLCDQLRRAVSGPADHISEGYGRFAPGDFGRFLSIAIGSLDEADNHLRTAAANGFLAGTDVAPLLVLVVRCRKATLKLRRYLVGPGRHYATTWKARQDEPS